MAAHLSDDEAVYRRIPPLDQFFIEPNRVTSANFKLDRRRGDLGLSVYRAAVLTKDQVLSKADAIPGSRLVEAIVGDIRRLASGEGDSLNLDVIVVADVHDPGHAEIRGPNMGQLSPAASNALRNLFKQA